MLAFVGILGAIQAFLYRIWIHPAALTVWMFLVGVAVITILGVEVVNRRNVVEVSRDRVRWSLRQPPDQGDLPLSDLKRVEISPSGARLVFQDGLVFASRADFTRHDIKRLVEGLRGLGAQVNRMDGAGDNIA
jgi:hypothetical protein